MRSPLEAALAFASGRGAWNLDSADKSFSCLNRGGAGSFSLSYKNEFLAVLLL